jgi:hypothetical protein
MLINRTKISNLNPTTLVEISKNFKKKMKLIFTLTCLAIALANINSAPLLEKLLSDEKASIATTPASTTESSVPEDKSDANNKKKRQYYNSMFITTNQYAPHTHSTPAWNYNNMNIYNPNDVNQFLLEHSNQAGYNTLFPNSGLLTTATKDPFNVEFYPNRFPSGSGVPGQNQQNGVNSQTGQYGFMNGQNPFYNQNQYNQNNQNPYGYQTRTSSYQNGFNFYSTPSPFNNQYNQNQNQPFNSNYNNQYQYPTTTQRTIPYITVDNVEETYSKSFNPYAGMPDPHEQLFASTPQNLWFSRYAGLTVPINALPDSNYRNW